MNVPHPAFSRPQPIVLDGRYCRLEPLGLQHADGLYAASADVGAGARYRYLFGDAPKSREELSGWITQVSASEDPMYFAVIDKATGRCEGRQALMRIASDDGCIEIGGIYWGPGMARSRIATEALFLHARYAFETLGNRRFEWKCNNLNEPSRRAALRFGFSFEGVFRQHMIQKGENRDSAWFSIIDGEWPRLKAGYERWLDPQNFDANGTQRAKLSF